MIKGLCMGAADTVPGVSGGTIALITGIYEDLLTAIKSANVKMVTLLLKVHLVRISRSMENNAFRLLLILQMAPNWVLAGMSSSLVKKKAKSFSPSNVLRLFQTLLKIAANRHYIRCKVCYPASV